MSSYDLEKKGKLRVWENENWEINKDPIMKGFVSERAT